MTCSFFPQAFLNVAAALIRPTFFYAIHHPEVLAIVGHKTTELDTRSEAMLTDFGL